jgi:NOL1/NOP2/fmu family ribosome biogenesis protein
MKAGEPGSRRRAPKSKRQAIASVDKKSTEELSRWVVNPEQMRFFEAGDTMYGCRKEHYADIEALSGVLAVIYSGVAMGQIFKGSLKPDGALALYVGLRREQVECRELNSEQALQFLRKQELEAEWFKEGVNMVLCEGLPLGFVKRVGGRVNNMYPNALRILK